MNMNRLKLLLLSISPFFIGELLGYAILELGWYGRGLSLISIIFCIYWFFVGYKSYDYGKSAKESILLGNIFAIIGIVLVLFQELVLGRYIFNFIGSAFQTFFLPMVRVSSLIKDMLLFFIRYTSSFMIHAISFILMMIIFYSGYYLAKTFNEGR